MRARPSSVQNVAYFSGSFSCIVLDRREHLPDQALADQLDLAVLLQDLAGDVERQVVRVDDTLDEAQVLGDERLAVVHDEHALDVELHAALGVAPEQVHRRVAGEEQQRLVLERALGRQLDRLQRLAPVVADVPVELGVLLLGHVLLRPRPQRLRELTVSSPTPDGPGDEVRVALHVARTAAGFAKSCSASSVSSGLRCSVTAVPCGASRDLGDRVGALPRRLPADAHVATGLAGGQLDAVGDHEAGVEPDAELPDQLAVASSDVPAASGPGAAAPASRRCRTWRSCR